MTRRTLTVNQSRTPSKRRSDPRPTCVSVRPGTAQRCVLDPDHRNRHFADGREWDDEEAAA
jgi:hypothetical protein